MIGIFINGLLLVLWFSLWGLDVLSLDEVAPAIGINATGLAVCALLDGRSS